jgi:hypothetical protein
MGHKTVSDERSLSDIIKGTDRPIPPIALRTESTLRSHVLCLIEPPASSLLCTLACTGVVPPWFGIVDSVGNMRNGTLFARGLMTLIALFVWLHYLNNFISAGVLVVFFMTNLLLILLRHKSPDDNPGLLERHLALFNTVISFLSGPLLAHVCTLTIGYALMCLCCLVALRTCIRIKPWCPTATYFGGKTQRATMQHMTVGILLVEEEYFPVPLVPYLPLLGIALNWYLAAQLPWTNLAFLVLFLSLVAVLYFSFGYQFSMGNNGGWDAYGSCRLSIHCCHLRRQAAPHLSLSAIWPEPPPSLSCTQRIFAFVSIAGVPIHCLNRCCHCPCRHCKRTTSTMMMNRLLNPCTS